MEKLLVFSVVPMVVVLAAWAARDEKPRRGLRLGFYAMFAFHLVYVLGLLYVLPRL